MLSKAPADTERTLTAPVDFIPPEQPVNEALYLAELPGRYTVKGEKGRGGIGRVMIALDEQIGREIAIKELIKPGETAQGISASRIRFLREARVTGQLEHPGIVPVYEIGVRSDRTLYYTMRLVRGKTLSKAILEAASLKERLRLLPHFRDICNAIAYAHSRGVVHRDIKPDNVMIGQFGETVMLDWGLAKVHGEQDDRAGEFAEELKALSISEGGRTVTGRALGTPAYMPPEQAKGLIDEIDERSDIYSLGAVLYEILTGHAPFDGQNAWEIIQKVLHERPPAITSIEQNAPADLCAVVAKTLTPEKELRYQSAIEVAHEIENYMAGGKVQAYEYSSWELIKRFVRQNVAASIAIAVVLITILVATLIIFNAYQDSIENERRAHLNLALGYQENADRLIRERQYEKARIFAAAALLHNPYNPLSPWRFRNSEQMGSYEAAPFILPARSSYYVASVFRNDAFIKTLTSTGAEVRSLAISRDGATLALASRDRTVRLWDMKNGREADSLAGHRDEVSAVAFSPDSALIASASWDKSIKIWDVATRTELATLTGSEEELFAVDFFPGGKMVAGGGNDSNIIIWNTADAHEIKRITLPDFKIRALAIAPDGSMIAAASADGRIALTTKDDIKIFKGHNQSIAGIRFSPDGRLFATASYDKSAKVWNSFTLAEENVLRHWDAFFSLNWSADGASIALASRDSTIKLWKLAQRRIETLRGHEGEVWNAIFTPDGRQLLSIGTDRSLKLWKTSFSRMVRMFDGHSTYIPSIAFSPDGRYLASSSWDRSIRLWDTVQETELTALHNTEVSFALAFSPDGSMLASAAQDRKIHAYSLPTLKELFTLEGHTDGVYSLAFSSDGKTLVSGSWDKTVRLWNVAEKRLFRTINRHASSVQTIDFSSDGALIASAGRDRLIVLTDSKGGEHCALAGHKENILSVAFSQNGALLASAGEDREIMIWDTKSCGRRAVLKGHSSVVNMVKFSPDGKYLLSIGKEALLWETGTYNLLLSLGLSYTGYSGAFSHDGTHVAITDGAEIRMLPLTLQISFADPSALLKESEEEAGRNLKGFSIIEVLPGAVVK